MGVLSALKPEKVFFYFEEISKIPHGSFNMKGIAGYVENFGRSLGFETIRDENDNVVILAPASAGYEQAPAVMLQGHMDMVAAKESASDFDFSKDALRLFVDGDLIGAKETTLGGDNGIAVAMMMALLSDPKVPHPALECVFTVNEEVGLLGAAALDYGFSKAKYLLNLDQEGEGVFLVSCAGGAHLEVSFPVDRKKAEGKKYELKVTSSKGGHSGAAIHKDRPNTNVVLCQLLAELQKDGALFEVLSVNGGHFDNAIPTETVAELIASDLPSLKPYEDLFRTEFASTDDTVEFSLKEFPIEEAFVLDRDSLDRFLFFMEQAPNGVLFMNHAIEGLVDTSLNLGTLVTEKDELRVAYLIRSSSNSRKERVIRRLLDLAKRIGAKGTVEGNYPGWAYKKESRLREICMETWNRLYPERPARVEAIHAGVECGLILQGVPGLDIVAIGPDMMDIHTPRERLSISSVQRCYGFILDILKGIKDE